MMENFEKTDEIMDLKFERKNNYIICMIKRKKRFKEYKWMELKKEE